MSAQPNTNLRRYARMYHRVRRAYGNVTAPGPDPSLVMFAHRGWITPTPRRELRHLRWYERLLNL